MRSPLERFSDRVENYILYRPSYPAQIIDVLVAECGLSCRATVADVGCGPGNLAALLLPHAGLVFGIEPNQEMRLAAKKLLQIHSNFVPINGQAEATTLPDSSVDLITAGQAFHWFEPEQTKLEFRRIIGPNGFVALVWNTRLDDSGEFARSYEALLRETSHDYRQVDHRNIDNAAIKAFIPVFEYRSFANSQEFNWEGLRGRALSSSYVPNVDAECEEFLARLQRIFDAHAKNGSVSFDYRTELYFGKPA